MALVTSDSEIVVIVLSVSEANEVVALLGAVDRSDLVAAGLMELAEMIFWQVN